MENNNSIFTIFPYKFVGAWVFDDDRVGLVREAFVAGADTLLDRLTGGRDKCSIVFSDKEFPGFDVKLDRKDLFPEWGTDYFCEQLAHDVWLCPALNLYYPESPRTIYLKVNNGD